MLEDITRASVYGCTVKADAETNPIDINRDNISSYVFSSGQNTTSL